MTRQTRALVWTITHGLLLGQCAQAQESPSWSYQRAADQIIHKYRVLTRKTGVVAAVVEHDRLIWAGTDGVANRHTKRELDLHTGFLIGSISKTVTAIAALRCVEEGTMKLDTDVSEYLPFQIRNPKNKGTVTLRSLLTHTSSISDDHYTNYSLPPRIFYTLGVKPTISLHEFCVGFFRAGGAYYDAESFLSASRGTRCQYSDLAYALIGYLVERVTKEPFSEYCKRRIFRPLGMLDTSFDLKDYKVGSGYSNLTDYNPSNAIQAYLRTDTVGQYSVSDYPNGWLRTSALDLSIFMRMLLAGGTWRGARILSGKTLSSMFKPQVPKTVLDFSLQSSGVTPGKTLLAQGYSFYQYRFNKASYWGHDGADDTGPVAGMWLDLERNRGAFILSNTYDGEDELATENLHHSIQQLLELKCHRRQP